MADWRQIQARIRKARNSADPVSALTEIYQRTRDAMAAFELAKALEKAERTAEAIEWYSTAAERFRRADWKRKAHDALARLGAPVPQADAESQSSSADGQASMFAESDPAAAESDSPPGADGSEEESEASADEASEPAAESAANGGAAAPGGKKRRRGRRGGRGRRRGKGGKAVVAPPAKTSAPARETPAPRAAEQPRERHAAPSRSFRGDARPPLPREEPDPETHTVGSAFAAMRGRTGDPGMASRLARLESQLRRLLGATPFSLDDVDSAPAGPGVFVISESDQTTYYYIEACRTLRIALAQIARARGSGGVRSQLAEHLGITESKVSKYLKDHCVVRWLQLDEDSARLAHFAIAVLRPALNE